MCENSMIRLTELKTLILVASFTSSGTVPSGISLMACFAASTMSSSTLPMEPPTEVVSPPESMVLTVAVTAPQFVCPVTITSLLSSGPTAYSAEPSVEPDADMSLP
eukprot:6201266-Pleurochrysis_carterae.AAC.8